MRKNSLLHFPPAKSPDSSECHLQLPILARNFLKCKKVHGEGEKLSLKFSTCIRKSVSDTGNKIRTRYRWQQMTMGMSIVFPRGLCPIKQNRSICRNGNGTLNARKGVYVVCVTSSKNIIAEITLLNHRSFVSTAAISLDIKRENYRRYLKILPWICDIQI